MFVQDRVDAGLVGGEALLQFRQRRPRLVVAHRREAQRLAAAQSSRPGCRGKCRCPCRAGTRRRDRSHRDEASVFAFLAIRCESTASWFAKSTSRNVPPALADLLRGLLREFEHARCCPALSASSPLASDVRLVSLASQPLGGRVDLLPARLDGVQQLERGVVLCHIEADAARGAAAHQRVEVGLEPFAAVLHRRECGRLALRRERAAAGEPLRQHLHFGRGRRRGSVLRRLARVEEHHQRREHAGRSP